MRRLGISIPAILLLVYLGFGILLYLLQDSFIYHPLPEKTNSEFNSLKISSEDISLKIWQANPGKDQAVIFFPGNAEDAESSLHTYKNLLPEHTVYGVNYRGYGGSTGNPSQAGLFTDALNIYDAIKEDHLSISVIGRSLGTGVAVFLATQRDINKVALITPYDSILSVAQNRYPLYPVSWLLRDQYDSAALAPKLNSETLILAAERDQLIPTVHAENLAQAIPDPLDNLIIVPWVGHNKISHSEEFTRYLHSFFSL